MRLSIGIDMGGTNTRLALIDEAGNLKYSNIRKTNYYGNNYLRNIKEMIYEVFKSTDKLVHGIGIGVPGTVDINSGIVIKSPALQWKMLNLKEYVEDAFDIDTSIENDVNAWTTAEKKIGAGRDCENFVMLTIGTGIGSGLFINNRLYRGVDFEAGEIGYLPIGLESYEEKSSSNDFGYFESKASAMATSYSYFNRTNENKGCREIFKLASEGDKEADFVIEEVYKYLGIGISNIICLLNPEKIILGGGMTKEGEGFLNRIKELVEGLIPIKTTLVFSETGSFGGAIGSGLMIFEQK